MSARTGRDEADDIVAASLESARRQVGPVPRDVPRGLVARSHALDQAIAFLSGPEAPRPRSVGLPGFRLLRHAASRLGADLLDSQAGGPLLGRVAVVHDALDTVVTAYGGAPDLFANEDDWGPDEDGDGPNVTCPGLSGTASTAAMFARDGIAHLCRAQGPEGRMMHREATGLVGACLILSAALMAPEGAPAALVRPIAEAGNDAFERLLDSVRAWRAVASPALPAAMLDDLAEVGAMAASVYAEIGIEAEASCGPRI